MNMKPKISIITLGVSNLEKSLHFYRNGLGFPTHNYKEEQGIVFFKVMDRKERMGVNPKTGERIKIAASKRPKFTPGKVLKEMVK